MNKSKNKNLKKRQSKCTQKTKRDANKALDSCAVVVLVEENVPPGAIAVFGKGLGYVPSPVCNVTEEQLQMRQTVNRI